MPAPKGNTYAKGNKGGNPGYGQMSFIRDKVEKHSEDWWKQIIKMMKGKDKELKKFAMAEFNKLQVKMIPQDITSGNEPLQITWQSK